MADVTFSSKDVNFFMGLFQSKSEEELGWGEIGLRIDGFGISKRSNCGLLKYIERIRGSFQVTQIRI